ncbi:S9 family peptidase [Phenylobacterium aquaticum]|uniref:alpha/beta hydrolase family protein n=1 Tax=Phenylobacterium aquaticum TaxID=1763816 RepID=UPI0026ED1245|nr:S9 family peptidase [Phenylobacterium aquaticum]
MKPFRLAVLAAALTAAPHAIAAPLEAYGKLPNIEQVAISPDGQKLGVIWSDGVQRRIVVRNMATGKLSQLGAGDVKVRSLDWAGPDHLLITTSTTSYISGVEAPRGEYAQLLDYDLAQGKVRPLMRGADESLNIIIGTPMVREVKGKTVVIVEGVSFVDNKGVDSLFQLDLKSGSSKIYRTGFKYTKDWVVGGDGEPLAEAEYNQETGAWTLRNRLASGGWGPLMTRTAPLDHPNLQGLGRTPDSFLISERVKDALVLHEVSASNPTVGEPLRQDLTGSLIQAAGGGVLLGFADLVGDEDVYTLLAPADAEAWRKIRRAYKGSRVQLVSWSADRSRIVVRVDPPDDGPSYALVDLKTGRADSIGFLYDDLKPQDVSPVRPIRYKAADGLEITGYLTLPNGRPDRKLPLVVLPHGGPAVRDDPGFDWWSQALASRGYAVLRVNFRGSAGFGRPFMEAGYGQWGRKMQSDLSDGVRFLAAEGTIDPARVCIAGASYGGYAALAGAVLDPKVYRCAVSVSGPADLPAMLATLKGSGRLEATRYWTRFMGAEDSKDPVLKDISPAAHVDQVRIPILLIHGKDDTVVPLAQSLAMERALRAAGKDVQMITLAGEDHWLSRGETRQQMLTSLVAFLEKNNPPN